MVKVSSSVQLIYILILLQLVPVISVASGKADSSEIFILRKQEFNTGIIYSSDTEREEVRSSVDYDFEELSTGAAQLFLRKSGWNILRLKQEEWNFQLQAGPFWGNGNFIDSSALSSYSADHEVFGVQGLLSGGYLNRYYYDSKNYTIVSLNGYAGFSYYSQDAEGLLTDSNKVSTVHAVHSDETKFRAGFRAKAGWGIGRLNFVNHYVTASVLLEKFYPGRVFSEREIITLTREIARIKNSRNVRAGHDFENETDQLKEFLNWKMLLEVPSDITDVWELSELSPRLEGRRVEFGPFFNYFNREPDFVYGGYVHFEDARYCSAEWNRNFSVNLSYNGYKHHDWIFMEASMGWSYYAGLRSEYSFGLKYVPGMVVNSLDDLEPVRHGFIPFIGYFSQLNSRYRMEAELSLRIAPVEQFVVPGPQFSLSLYRSRY